MLGGRGRTVGTRTGFATMIGVLAVLVTLLAPGAAVAKKAATSTVESVSPATGPTTGSTVVTITGSGFSEATQVYFGATPAAGFSVISANEVTATAHAEPAGKVAVKVETPQGLGRAKGPGSKYKFTPVVSSVSPGTGPAAGGALVTINGSGFRPGTGTTRIAFGGAKASPAECPSSTECTAPAPPMGALGELGPVDVTVRVHNIPSPKTAADHFTYQALLLVNEEGVRYNAGTRLTIRSVIDGAESICFPHAGGTITANRGEAEISTSPASEFGACERQDFFGRLPSGYGVKIDATGAATVYAAFGTLGVKDSNGCIYEALEMHGKISTEERFLRVHVSGGFPNVPTTEEEQQLEYLRSQLADAEAELEAVEREINEVEGEEGEEAEAHREELRERRTQIESHISTLEGQIAEAEGRCLSEQFIELTLEEEKLFVRQLG